MQCIKNLIIGDETIDEVEDIDEFLESQESN